MSSAPPGARSSHPSQPARLRALLVAVTALWTVGIACTAASPTGEPAPPTPTAEPTPPPSIFDTERTAFGFFPTPPDATLESVLRHFETLGEHADFILIQPNIPWEDFRGGIEGESERRTDLRNQVTLARQNGLEWIFVVDPLNGLNRREFFGLPAGWAGNFGNPDVRRSFSNFALWILREFEPRYLGLASEINTYIDAHPDDVENYLTLYRETYDRVKAEAPETQVFVTFQWDDLNNMFAPAAEGRPAGQTNWEQVEAFEPRLDLWAISSYPYFVFPTGQSIPGDYYARLSERTDRPLAMAEGGWPSRDVGPFQGDEAGQVAYLEAIDSQLGDRLAFWVYLVLSDFNMDAFAEVMRQEGRQESDIETLSLFSTLGLLDANGGAKPALAIWDGLRSG